MGREMLHAPYRVQLEDGRGAEVVRTWDCGGGVFDGHNNICSVSRSQWSCTDLALTVTGLWLRCTGASGPSGGYQGAVNQYEVIETGEAAGLAAILGVDIPELANEVV